ncbi:hypothetical protein SLUN_00190 [Streptomyces lunaelactis]|uniref:SnoaL-like domain-containing protein n=1 Tax=Streptomyces lunaelactis TaxID=1535768 RepID=A0A2R4SVL4_9ACTN|nr:hypothetical protein SLUN_00190 [Streptomyces lunaelactis]
MQQMLTRSWPADLAPALERQLVRDASRIWRADVTGADRDKWPRYFSHNRPGRAAFTRVRIQAGIARADTPGRAQVHLVWAGADPSGELRDGRTAVIRFSRADTRWEPIR